MKWKVGIVTCEDRMKDEKCTYHTLCSVYESGMHESRSKRPRLFANSRSCSVNVLIRDWGPPDDESTIAPESVRDPDVGAYGNWFLTAWELYLADPKADRYAIFEDDVRACINLRVYLESCPYPDKGYQNLILYPANHKPDARRGEWYVAPNPCGLGAQGLVFSNEAMRTLLKGKYFVEYAQMPNYHEGVDGVIHSVMQWAGWQEYVHYPSLLYHINAPSTQGHPPQPEINTFVGEEFDAMTLKEAT